MFGIFLYLIVLFHCQLKFTYNTFIVTCFLLSSRGGLEVELWTENSLPSALNPAWDNVFIWFHMDPLYI